VIVAFGLDFLFRTIEKMLATPPRGRVARAAGGRRTRRIDLVVKQVEALSGRN
jgi:hypothetical protein